MPPVIRFFPYVSFTSVYINNKLLYPFYATLLLLMFTSAALAISPLSDYLLGLDDPLPYISLFLSLLPV